MMMGLDPGSGGLYSQINLLERKERMEIVKQCFLVKLFRLIVTLLVELN